MKAENRKIMEECRKYANMVATNQKPQGISYQQRLDLERIIKEEFQPGYSSNRDCEACVNAMISLAFYYYDNYYE